MESPHSSPSPSGSSSADKDQLIGRAVEEYFQAVEAGLDPRLNDFVKRFPDIADVLKTVIPAMRASQPSESKRQGEERTLGDFRILRQIGRGGMGIVYHAEQISMRRHVALKVLPLAGLLDTPKILRFQSEVRAVASLDHPNIVSVYSVGEERGTHYFAMQLIRGSSLAEVIRALRNMHDGEPTPQGAHSDIANSIATGGNFSVSATDDFDGPSESSFPKNETILQNNSSTIPSRTRREYFRGIVALAVQAADALEHAHGRGIVH